MKILQINASYKPAYIYGGPTMSVSKLSEQLVATGYEVQVFTTTANGIDELPVHRDEPVIIAGVPVYYFSRVTKDHSHFSPGLLKALWLKVKEFDIVHIHAWWNTVSVLSALIAVTRGVPVVLSPRGTLSKYSFINKNAFIKRCIHQLLTKPLLRRCSIHATSPYESDTLKQIIIPKRIFTLPNFIELPDITSVKRMDDPQGPLKLLFFSRVEEKKGLDILLNALVEVDIPYHLTIAGTGDGLYVDSLKQLAIKNGVAENITWIGFKTENKFNILANHHLLVLPSHDENFGNVVIESLYTGTAVLISNKVGLSDYVAKNKLGWICGTDAGSVAAAINKIERDKLMDIRRVSKAIIRRDFNEVALTQKYTTMYQQIIQHG